jgi:type VI protein secretion system component VasK
VAQRLRTRPPVWPIIAVGLFIFFWVAASIWLALALALCVGILFAAHWAWTALPQHFSHGPDRAELAEREKRERELGQKRRRSR